MRVRDIPHATLNTLRGREILASVFHPNTPMDPLDIDVEQVDPAHEGWDTEINTNRLPNLSRASTPWCLRACCCRACGASADNGGGDRRMTFNLVVATLIHDCIGRQDHSCPVGTRCRAADRQCLHRTEFGAQVALHVRNLLASTCSIFSTPGNSVTPRARASSSYANAIAAITSDACACLLALLASNILATLCPDKRAKCRPRG